MWRAGASCAPYTGHTGSVYGVALSGDGQRAVSASGDKTLKVWDVASGRELRTLAATRLCHWRGFDAGRAAAVSASDDKTLKVWEVESGRELRTLKGHTSIVYAWR